MKKIISKKINGFIIVIATNDNGELKIGSKKAFEEKHMGAYAPFSDMWFPIDSAFLHIIEKNNELWCNIDIDINIDNDSFPYLLFTEKETSMLRSIMIHNQRY